MNANKTQQKINNRNDKYKNEVKQMITEIKSDEEKNDEQIIRFFHSDFMEQYEYEDEHSVSETTNLETISINTDTASQRSESYHSFNNNNSMENASDAGSECEDAKNCARLVKFLLGQCFCIDDDEE